MHDLGHSEIKEGTITIAIGKAGIVLGEERTSKVSLTRDSTWSLDGLPVQENANFLMVGLREDFSQGDWELSISI